jgi:dihydrofolate reductase
MQIIIIAAVAQNRVIGYKNTIPWQIKGEQKLFKEHTLGHTVIMGRKTFESIGKPLTGRKNIIISTNSKNIFNHDGAIIASSIEDALDFCKNDEKVFIIGGSNVYKQTINIADYIYLTILKREVIGDSFFPEIDENFILISSEEIQLSENVTFAIYKRDC